MAAQMWTLTRATALACMCAFVHDRKDGTIERQYRLNVGKLPVAYK